MGITNYTKALGQCVGFCLWKGLAGTASRVIFLKAQPPERPPLVETLKPPSQLRLLWWSRRIANRFPFIILRFSTSVRFRRPHAQLLTNGGNLTSQFDSNRTNEGNPFVTMCLFYANYMRICSGSVLNISAPTMEVRTRRALHLSYLISFSTHSAITE